MDTQTLHWLPAVSQACAAQVLKLFPSAAGLKNTWHSIVKIGQSLYREAPGMDVFRPDQETPVRRSALGQAALRSISGYLGVHDTMLLVFDPVAQVNHLRSCVAVRHSCSGKLHCTLCRQRHAQSRWSAVQINPAIHSAATVEQRLPACASPCLKP